MKLLAALLLAAMLLAGCTSEESPPAVPVETADTAAMEPLGSFFIKRNDAANTIEVYTAEGVRAGDYFMQTALCGDMLLATYGKNPDAVYAISPDGRVGEFPCDAVHAIGAFGALVRVGGDAILIDSTLTEFARVEDAEGHISLISPADAPYPAGFLCGPAGYWFRIGERYFVLTADGLVGEEAFIAAREGCYLVCTDGEVCKVWYENVTAGEEPFLVCEQFAAHPLYDRAGKLTHRYYFACGGAVQTVSGNTVGQHVTNCTRAEFIGDYMLAYHEDGSALVFGSGTPLAKLKSIKNASFEPKPGGIGRLIVTEGARTRTFYHGEALPPPADARGMISLGDGQYACLARTDSGWQMRGAGYPMAETPAGAMRQEYVEILQPYHPSDAAEPIFFKENTMLKSGGYVWLTEGDEILFSGYGQLWGSDALIVFQNDLNVGYGQFPRITIFDGEMRTILTEVERVRFKKDASLLALHGDGTLYHVTPDGNAAARFVFDQPGTLGEDGCLGVKDGKVVFADPSGKIRARLDGWSRDLTLSGAFIANGVHRLQYLLLHPETGEIDAKLVEFFYNPATGEGGVISP